jgi:single-strand DNA-binding protein
MKSFGLARVGRDTEIRITSQGEPVANVSLAFSWGRRDESGRRQTTWVDGTLWGKRAETLAPMLLKGTPCAVLLEDLHLETFTARDGNTNTKLVARILDVDLMGVREQGASAPAPAPAPAAARSRLTAPPPAPAAPDDFDDIPF